MRVFGAILAALCLILFLQGLAFSQELLTLDKALELALSQNRAYRQSEYDRSAGRWGAARSVSGWLPKVSYKWSWSQVDDETLTLADEQYEFTKQFSPDAYRTLFEDNYANSIYVLQPIFNGAAEYAAIRQGALACKGSKFIERDRRLQTVLETKTAYYALQKAIALEAVAAESMKLSQQSYNLAKSRMDIGMATKSDLLRWEAAVATAEGNLVQVQNAQALARIELARIIGQPLLDEIVLPEFDPQVDAGLMEKAQAAAKAGTETPLPYTGHPAMAANRTNVGMSQVEIERSVGSFLPNVNFTYEYKWLTNDTPEPDDDTSWVMAVGVEIPLFQGLGAITGTGQSVQSKKSARMGYEDFSRTFLQQFHSSRLETNAARLRLLSAQKAEASSRENLAIIQSRTELGMTSNLDQLDAQVAYIQARSDLIGAVADFYIALARWDYFTADSGDKQ